MPPNSSGSLEDELGELRARVRRLEETLRRYGMVVDGEAARAATGPPSAAGSSLAAPTVPAPPPAAASSPVAANAGQAGPAHGPAPGPPRFVAPPRLGYADKNAPAPARSLESRIGSQWFNRVGILAMLIGAAWFLKLAFDNHWIGPLGRVLIGLAAGAALIVWSERFQRRGFAAFSYSLKAVGSGILYLSLWAGFSLYALLPAGVAFAAMIAVTALNGLMAWRRNAELLALYAIAGGLSTPLLVSSGGNHEVALFSYLLMLDVAALILAMLRPWSRLLFVAFIGTALFIFGWWIGFYTQQQAGRTAFFVGCFFVLFALAPRLVLPRAVRGDELSAWESLAMVVMPLVNAGLGFLAFYNVLSPSSTGWAGPWLAIAFAGFYLALLRLPAWSVMRASPALLSALHLAMAVVFLIVAIPLKTHGRWLTIGWLAEGGALIWLARRLAQNLLQVLGLICLALGVAALLLVDRPVLLTPFFNPRFATYAAAIAIFAFVAWLARMAGDGEEPQPPMPWRTLAATAVLVVNLLILLAVSLEIHSYWWLLHRRESLAEIYEYRIYAQFSYSAFFMIFGAALLTIGFWRRSSFLRWQALVLLAATIAKVFLVDISRLSQGLRVISFLGLGALLLAVSFVYQRDWLNLRGQGE